jgi:hypothetical protein
MPDNSKRKSFDLIEEASKRNGDDQATPIARKWKAMI